MKKYWKFAMFLGIIVIGLGAFYTYAAATKGNYPQFKLETQSGDEKLADAISLGGNYTKASLSEELIVSGKGTTYEHEKWGTQQNLEYPIQSELRRLSKEHRKFMRGKQDLSTLYDDKNKLVYAEYNWEKKDGFKISVLEKATEKITDFKVSLPNQEKYNYLYIQDIQLINNKLKIITLNDIYVKDRNSKEALIYTIDLDSKKMIDDERVLETIETNNENISTEIFMAQEYDVLKPMRYLLYTVQPLNSVEKNGEWTTEVISTTYTLYDLETEKKEVIKLPDALNNESVAQWIDGNIAYFTKWNKDGKEIIPYDLEKREVKESFIVKYPNVKHMENEVYMTAANGKLYFNTSSYIGEKKKLDQPKALVWITDNKTGKKLYEGAVLDKKKTDQTDDGEVTFYNLILK